MESILQTERRCFICAKNGELDCHHAISGVSNRKNSDKYGLMIWLCRGCHSSLHDKGKVFIDDWHYIAEDDIKAYAQAKWEETYGSREEFVKIFGKSFILGDKNE